MCIIDVGVQKVATSEEKQLGFPERPGDTETLSNVGRRQEIKRMNWLIISIQNVSSTPFSQHWYQGCEYVDLSPFTHMKMQFVFKQGSHWFSFRTSLTRCNTYPTTVTYPSSQSRLTPWTHRRGQKLDQGDNNRQPWQIFTCMPDWSVAAFCLGFYSSPGPTPERLLNMRWRRQRSLPPLRLDPRRPTLEPPHWTSTSSSSRVLQVRLSAVLYATVSCHPNNHVSLIFEWTKLSVMLYEAAGEWLFTLVCHSASQLF